MSDLNNLKDMTKLGAFFGRISEVHVKNMQSFPWIFFNDLKEVKLDYNIATKKEDSSIVSYDLQIDGENDNLSKRYEALESAIRGLFWKEVKIEVKINGQEVYKSE